MKKLLAMLIALTLCITGSAFAEEGLEFFMQGETVPDFSVELCDRSTFTLSEALEDHDMVMINIWATWCSPCRMEFPYMEEAYSLYSDRVALVCLSAEPTDTNEVIANYKAENGLTILPMGADTIGISDIVVLEGYPTTIVVDKFGCYAYYECGSMLTVEQFTNVFDFFLSEEYTEPVFMDSTPRVKPDIANPNAVALTAAASDGSVLLSCDFDDEYAWPFLPAAGGVVSSNTSTDSSAVLTASVSASAGDALVFDYDVQTESMCGVLEMSVNDDTVTAMTGNVSGSYAYRFEIAGEYHVRFTYTMFQNSMDGSGDTASLSGIRLLKGEAAEAAVDAMPVYPRTLEGAQMSVAPVGDNVREIVINDSNGMLEEYFGEISYYIVDGDTAAICANVGTDISPELAMMYGDCDNVYHILSKETYIDGQGYVTDILLNSIEAGGYSSTYAILFDNYVSGNNYTMSMIFANEENVNYFLNCEFIDDEGIPMCDGWMYADGSMPATDALPVIPCEMVGGMYEYTISTVDETGAPVTGVMVNVCTDETCAPGMVDENGVYTFEGALYPYSIHVLIVPDGYSADTSAEYIMEGLELTIVIPHK